MALTVVSSTPSRSPPSSPGTYPHASPAVVASPSSQGTAHRVSPPIPTAPSPSLSRPVYLPPQYLVQNAPETCHAIPVPPVHAVPVPPVHAVPVPPVHAVPVPPVHAVPVPSGHSPSNGEAREGQELQGCLCCLRSFSPTLFVSAVLGTWMLAGGVGGEMVLALATLPAIFVVYGLHASVKARSLPGVSLLEFFWLGAFLSVFVAMCLELLANATLYNALLSCLPPLPSRSHDSQRASDDLRSLASGSANVDFSPPSDSPLFRPPHADPLSPSAPSSSLFLSLLQFLPSWTPAPLLAPLSLPFYFPLFESMATPGCLRQPSLQSHASAALNPSSFSSALSTSAFSASSLFSASPLSAFSFLPDHTGERWQRLLSTLSGKHAHGALPTLGCSLSLVAFMIFCVGLVEEFAKLVVLQRLQVLPAPPPLAWGGAEEASSERRNALEQRAQGGCCRPFWTRYVKYPVGVCIAGCAAGAGFAVAENLSYTLGRRGVFAEHLIVAIVRTFTAVPSHIANTGMAAANLALAWHAACAAPAASPFFSSHLEAHQQPLIPDFSRSSGHALPSFWRRLLPSLLVPSLLHGTYDAALRLSAAYAQPGPALDDDAAVVAAVFLLVSFLAWLLTLLLFWQKWRSVRDLPAFGASCAPAFGPTPPELRRVRPQDPVWDSRAHWVFPQAVHAPETGADDPLAGSAAQSAPFFCSPGPQRFAHYAVAPAFPFTTPAAGTGETGGVRADVLVWEERRRQANRRNQQHANSLHAFAPAPAALREVSQAAAGAARASGGGDRGAAPRDEKPTGERARPAQR
ncbi:UNVERIFIED_CONTAM: hypothetical protein HHA_215010 [Hammondia hammondi]|eukprot:XP_008886695.1 hypothetical protein HHA_215010 [Hammondia hammondi]